MNYSHEQICEMAKKAFSALNRSDFITVSKHYKKQVIREETHGWIIKRKKQIVTWEPVEEPIATFYVLRKVVYKNIEYGLLGVDHCIVYYAISDSGKLVTVSARDTLMDAKTPPENFSVHDMTENEMALFNYEFITWEHKTEKFREWGYGSRWPAQDADIDNYNRFPNNVQGLKPGRIFTGKNEGLYLLLLAIAKGMRRRPKDGTSNAE